MSRRSVSSEVASLRAEALRLHRNTTSKISKNNAKRGADLSGTEFDPRVSPSKVKRYNRQQLASYIAKLEKFNSRKTQFVPDSQYRPIPAQKWREYKDAEKALNKEIRDRYSTYSGIKLPSGLTVAQQLSMFETTHPQMHNPASNAGIRELDRHSKSVKSLLALEKLTQDTKKRTSREHKLSVEAANRKSVNDMMDIIGNDNWKQRIDALSSTKLDILWNLSAVFANAVGLFYEVAKKLLSDKESKTERWMDTVISNATKEIERYLSWVEKLRED